MHICLEKIWIKGQGHAFSAKIGKLHVKSEFRRQLFFPFCADKDFQLFLLLPLFSPPLVPCFRVHPEKNKIKTGNI